MDEHNIHKETKKSDVRGMLIITLIMASIALGAYTYLTIKKAGYLSPHVPMITVSGEGEVFAKPDIATFSFSVIAEGDDAATAQDESARAVNEILAYLEEEGIEERDIKTQYYNLNPRYDYMQSVCREGGYCPPGERVLRGYEVNQTIQVKVRNVDNAGSLISGVGTRGATNVSGLQFTIDEDDVFIAEARAEAIADAKEKAEKLADDLDVEIVRIAGFNENGGYYPQMYRAESMAMDTAEGLGGGAAPTVPTGENTFSSYVTITYEVE